MYNIRRKEYDSLISWKNRLNRKPLVVRGARQVGKSFLIREFSGSGFQKIVEINFEKNPEFIDLFRNATIHEVVRQLETLFKVPLQKAENVLLFLDEIQSAPHAI